MLPHEVEPFADGHIQALMSVIDNMNLHLDNPELLEAQRLHSIREWRNDLHVAIGGFRRFKTCMADEIEQKEKVERFLQDNQIRLNVEADS